MSAASASSPIVLDASALADVLLDDGRVGGWAAERIGDAERLHAPHVIDLEVASVVRRRTLRAEMSPRRAKEVLLELIDLRLVRYPATPMLVRIWDLRGRLSAYDAAYVALAEALDVPLVTTDRRLARAGGHGAEIVAYPG